tara:strand:- start:161 stop:523 length:363 start_codon:yes stop_codon:yes gene_type:complete
MILKDNIIEMLKQCVDPEIPVDLWNLGLIYDINLQDFENNKTDVFITMSLTTPGCGMAEHMANDIKEKISSIEEVHTVEVNVTFDPPWNPEMMSDEARKKLGFNPTPGIKNEPEIKTEWE